LRRQARRVLLDRKSNMFQVTKVSASLLVFSALASGCSLDRFAADQAGGIAAKSARSMRGFWDYDIARSGTAAAIMQLEAMHSVSPDNAALSLTLASSYVGHAFGWVELDMERARAAHEFTKAIRLRARAELLYKRARDLSLAVLRHHDAKIDDVIKGDLNALREYLMKNYPDRDDLAPLFWTATAWGSMLGVTEQLDQAVDLPAVRVMIEHVVAIDPSYEDGAGLVFLGGVYSQTPPDYGGDPVRGKAFFERALQLTGRKSYMVQLNYAKLYALTLGDQKLFHDLLDEVLAPEDRGNDVRLSNKIARMHAEQLLASQSAGSR
jgi:hypothetical protein